MAKVFRTLRLNFLKKNNTARYLKYAFGEILLVVVGILLALQINNWNEDRKSKKELTTILKTISSDLKQDTLVAINIISVYDTIKANSNKLLDGKITKENHQKYPLLRSLVSFYSPFSTQIKGYEMLKKHSNQNEVQNDSVVSKILQFYTNILPLIEDNNEFIKKEVLKNIDDFKEKPWFVDWTQQKTTPEMITYFTSGEDFRKKVASNLIFAVSNHKKVIEVYKTNAKELINIINKKLKKNNGDI